jgi:hypothetical protein
MRLYLFLLMALPLFAPAARADTLLADYDATVRKSYARETKSQCLARARTTTAEIVVCGERDRKDRYRMTKGGYILPELAIVQSPAEKFLQTQTMIAAAQSSVGTGYTSSLAGIKQGYLRGSYKMVAQAMAGEDLDAE